jgi:recombinational DNA repair protein (RecF pathway)
MSYHIYTTDGIILKRTAFGEANVMLYVLTKDLGLIIASAKSARLSSSKLRPALQEFEEVSISCIKGKNGWKITNVISKGSFFFNYPVYAHKVMGQIVFVLLRTITGELPHPEIFETVITGLVFLKKVEEENISNFEALVVLRILYELGYVARSENTDFYLQDLTNWNEDLLDKMKEGRLSIVTVINKAIKESHL